VVYSREWGCAVVVTLARWFWGGRRHLLLRLPGACRRVWLGAGRAGSSVSNRGDQGCMIRIKVGVDKGGGPGLCAAGARCSVVFGSWVLGVWKGI